MSLTSYRAAPPRVGRGTGLGESVFWVHAFGRPGSDLLSRVLGRSTIGAEGFHGRVRDGIGCVAPRCGHQAIETHLLWSCQLSAVSHQLFSELTAESFVWGIVSHVSCTLAVFAAVRDGFCVRLPCGRWRKEPIERLGPVSFTHCCASTPGLSTWWSTTALRRDLVLREASRLDAFSGYPVRT